MNFLIGHLITLNYCFFLFFILFTAVKSETEQKEQDIELYYAYSVNKTYHSKIDVIYRDFYIVTRTELGKHQVDSVYIHHERKNDIYWGNIPASRDSSIIHNNTNITIWSAHLQWTSLGSPFEYADSFAVTCKKGNVSYWDNNQLHNYKISINDGYFIGSSWNIKVQSIDGVYNKAQKLFYLYGQVLVRNIDFSKVITVMFKLGDEEFQSEKANFYSSQNNFGIEKWKYQIRKYNITSEPKIVVAKFHYKVKGKEYIDDNFNSNYLVPLRIINSKK